MNTLSIFMSNYPGTNVNSVGKDMPIARIYSVMLPPLMPSANDMLASNDVMLASNDMLAVG